MAARLRDKAMAVAAVLRILDMTNVLYCVGSNVISARVAYGSPIFGRIYSVLRFLSRQIVEVSPEQGL